MRTIISLGVHIGQGQNPSAIAEVQPSFRSYNIIKLTRFPIETLYPDLGGILTNRILTLDQDYEVKVKVNATLVGSPVLDCFKEKMEKVIDLTNLSLKPIYLVGGYKTEEKDDELMLPMELMISHLKVLFQCNRIKLIFEKPEKFMNHQEKEQLHLLKKLEAEVLNYKTKVLVDKLYWNPETKIGETDDLITALGLACWSYQ
jgi:hypothetical protein